MTFQELKGMNFRDMIKAASIDNIDENVTWLQSLSLLASKMNCSRCNSEMFYSIKAKRSSVKVWRCQNRFCRSTTSVRKNSFFENRSVSIDTMLTFIYFWSSDCTQEMICKESKISRPTAVQISQLLREVCSVELQCEDPIGGPGHNVAIDGYMVSRGECRKRSKLTLTEYWVFSGVDLHTKECFMYQADQRDEKTLVEIIEQHVATGTNIYWPQWASELRFDESDLEQYNCKMINPDMVVEGITKTRINELQNLWQSWKAKELSKHYIHVKMIPSYMDEFMWRRKRSQDDVFSDILEAISKQYPVIRIHFTLPSSENEMTICEGSTSITKDCTPNSSDTVTTLAIDSLLDPYITTMSEQSTLNTFCDDTAIAQNSTLGLSDIETTISEDNALNSDSLTIMSKVNKRNPCITITRIPNDSTLNISDTVANIAKVTAFDLCASDTMISDGGEFNINEITIAEECTISS